jgi:mannosyltransferase
MAVSLTGDARLKHWTTVAAIIVAAIMFRVVALDAYGLWTDEALTIALSNWSIPDMFLLPTDPTPPLYYILHKLLIPANASVEVVRSISAVAGVMSVGLMYLVGRLAFGMVGGLIAAALLSVWTVHVDYSQEARAYSLLFFLTLLASLGVLSYARALLRTEIPNLSKARRRVALILFAAGNVLSFYTHVIATVWIILTSLLLLAIAAREQRIHRAELCSVFGAMAICASPGIYWLILQMVMGNEFHWLQQAELIDFAATTANVLLPIGLWDNSMADEPTRSILQLAVAGASLALLGTGVWFGRQRLRGTLHERPVVLWLILAYLSVPIIVWLFGFVARPMFMDRVILFAVPGMILLITAICCALGRRSAGRAAIAVVLLYAISTLLFGIMREKEDWRGAYRFLAAAAAPGDVIAICPFYNYPALRYHADTAVGSAVIAVRANRDLVQIEHGLGSNPDWDKAYFRAAFVPALAGRRAAPPGVPTTLRLQPGQSVWRIDGHCNPDFRASIDAALRPLAPGSEIAWVQKREGAYAMGIIVRRWRVTMPIALNVRDLTPGPQDRLSFRHYAGEP